MTTTLDPQGPNRLYSSIVHNVTASNGVQVAVHYEKDCHAGGPDAAAHHTVASYLESLTDDEIDAAGIDPGTMVEVIVFEGPLNPGGGKRPCWNYSIFMDLGSQTLH